jgi:uncharacterized protein (DUF1697 family)
MKRYAAFLRGVSPMNCKMPELKRALEAGGFEDVKTVLSSGNAVFGAAGARKSLRKKVEAAIEQHLQRPFLTLVRPIEELQDLLDADPYARFKLPAGAKRVVTFLPEAPSSVPKLPITLDTAKILAVRGDNVLSYYVPSPKGPMFMALIEKTFGKDVTTRTWETVRKACATGQAQGKE